MKYDAYFYLKKQYGEEKAKEVNAKRLREYFAKNPEKRRLINKRYREKQKTQKALCNTHSQIPSSK